MGKGCSEKLAYVKKMRQKKMVAARKTKMKMMLKIWLPSKLCKTKVAAKPCPVTAYGSFYVGVRQFLP